MNILKVRLVHDLHTAVIGVLFVLASAACGNSKPVSDDSASAGSSSKDGQSLTAESADSPDSTTGRCGDNVVASYVDMAAQCSELLSQEQADDCVSTVDDFLSRYPDADCEAEATSQIYGQNDTFRITEEKVREIKAIVSDLEF